jgi:hypothetical protein
VPSAADLLKRAAWGEPGQSYSRRLFEEEPVSLDRFVQDRKYLGNPPLSPVQYEAVRHAERIYYPETYEWLAQHAADPETRKYWGEPCRMVNFLELEWGKGGGKDHTCRIIALRVAYLLLCLVSPQAYYAMPEQDSIHILNVASSSKQASRAFFTPLRRAVLRPGNWFQTRGVDVAEASGRPLKADRTSALLDTVRFEKNIEAVSGHSDADSQEGLNLILGIADEIDAFRSRAELAKTAGPKMRESSSSAEAILDMLRTSASTRFPQTYKNIHISYPRYLGSTIQQLVKEGNDDLAKNGEKSRYYVSGPLATWEANPRVPGKEAFAKDYEDDPVLARAKYECKPSRAVNPYYSNEIALRECCRKVTQPPVSVDYVRDNAAWKPVYVFSPEFYPVKGAIYAVHSDLAVKGDRAGVAMAHVQKWQDHTLIGTNEEGLEVAVTERRPVVKVDFVIGYEADASRVPPMEIQIRWARMLFLELRRMGFPILRASYDVFQSKDSQQILESHGIETERFSTDTSEEGWRTLRDVAYEGRLDMPEDELLLTELLGLSRLPNGKIDHLGEGSKDLADALAGAVFGALTLGGQEDESGARAFIGQHSFTGPDVMAGWKPIGMVAPSAMDPYEPLGTDREGEYDTFHGLFGGTYTDDYGFSPSHQQ